MKELEEEARRANEARLKTERILELLNEKVKIAEEEAQAHARKNLQAEEEIRRVRASAVKVTTTLLFIVCEGHSYLICLFVCLLVSWCFVE